MWKRAKLVLTKASDGLFKWWINQRYQGHTRSYGIIKCTCDNQTTLNQTHIIHCPRFRPSYALTADEKDVSIQQIKHKLASREDDLDKDDIKELNDLESALSTRITNEIGRFQGPRAAGRRQ